VAGLRFLDGMRMCETGLSFCQRYQSLVMLMERPHFLFGQIFDIDESAARAFKCRHEFIEFQMHCLSVLVL
jgi:hypothetical protein